MKNILLCFQKSSYGGREENVYNVLLPDGYDLDNVDIIWQEMLL